MQNGDEASPSINLAGQALLVKMLMVYFHQILLAYKFLHCLDTCMRNKDEASVQPVMVSENAHNY